MEEMGRYRVVSKYKCSLCFNVKWVCVHYAMGLNSKFKSNVVTKWLARDLPLSTLIAMQDPFSVLSIQPDFHPLTPPLVQGEHRQNTSSLTDPTLSFVIPVTAPFSQTPSLESLWTPPSALSSPLPFLYIQSVVTPCASVPAMFLAWIFYFLS